MKDFELSVKPVQAYEAPELPKFGESNSSLLKKIPLRWQKSAKVLAGLGIVGVIAFSGCADIASEGYSANRPIIELRLNDIVHDLGSIQGSYSGYDKEDLLIRLHTGGAGSANYVVHLTEQEAFGIIRARLEAAGLDFNTTPPAGLVFEPVQIRERVYSEVDRIMRNSWGSLDIDLFDEQKGVGIINVGRLSTNNSFMLTERDFARRIEELFAIEMDNIFVGAFYNPGRGVSGGERPSDEEAEELRPTIVRQLVNQADIFIAQLQREGVLGWYANVDVTINGMPLDVGEYPIIINNQKMVPALELFDALDMRVSVDVNMHRRATTARRYSSEIRIHTPVDINADGGLMRASNVMVRNQGVSEWVNDIPVLVHNGVILAPLQFVADLARATVEWDETTQTIEISY